MTSFAHTRFIQFAAFFVSMVLTGVYAADPVLSSVELSKEKLKLAQGVIKALPVDTPEAQMFKEALQCGTERMALFALKGFTSYELGFLDEIITLAPAYNLPPLPSQPDGAMSLLEPLMSPSESNPFINDMIAGATVEINSPKGSWISVRPGKDPFVMDNTSSENHYRNSLAKMEAAVWLFAHPESPLRHDVRLIRTILNRAHTYCEAVVNNPNADYEKSGFIDDFGAVYATTGIREFYVLYGSLLTPSQKQLWLKAMEITGTRFMRKAMGEMDERHSKGYANICSAIGVILHNCGMMCNRPEWKQKGVSYLTTIKVYEDGATAYIWNQNECIGYHNIVTEFLARGYYLTKDARILETLKATEWYGPVSVGKLGEFWTAPSWKQQWNASLKWIAGGEPVIALTGNGWARSVEPVIKDRTKIRWELGLVSAQWYRNNVVPRPLPDRYTIPDRNIQGVRAWYGRWSYAATLREIPPSEPGHRTLMGAYWTEPDFSMRAIMMLTGPRIYLSGDVNAAESFASITQSAKTGLTIGRDFSVVSASYDLAMDKSSFPGPRCGWKGGQLWLGLPDRLIGISHIYPDTDAVAAAGVESALTFGAGGTVGGTPQSLKQLDERTFDFGGMTTLLHQTTFTKIEQRTVPFRTANYPMYEIVASVPPEPKQGAYLAFEVRSEGAAPLDSISVSLERNGYFQVLVISGNAAYLMYANTGSGNATLATALPQPPKDAYQAAWISGQRMTPAEINGVKGGILSPGQHIVMVRSTDRSVIQPGWKSYQEMVLQKP